MVWTLKYKNENEGEFIIGGYPHEYDKNYEEKNLKNVKAEMRVGAVFIIFLEKFILIKYLSEVKLELI